MRVENLGFLFDLAIVDFLGINGVYLNDDLIGNPKSFNKAVPFSLFLASVTTVTSKLKISFVFVINFWKNA